MGNEIRIGIEQSTRGRLMYVMEIHDDDEFIDADTL